MDTITRKSFKSEGQRIEGPLGAPEVVCPSLSGTNLRNFFSSNTSSLAEVQLLRYAHIYFVDSLLLSVQFTLVRNVGIGVDTPDLHQA